MIASVGHVSAHAPHDTQDDSRETRSSPAVMFGVEAAAGGGQREGALDLVARAHAAPARDAELVLEHEVRVALVVLRARARAPVQRGVADARARAPRVASSVCARGRLGQLREHELDDVRRRCGAPSRRRVSTFMPSRHGVVHAATGRGAPSTPTMQTRQAPNGTMRSSKQSVGTSAARGAAAVEHGRARRDLDRRCRRS